MVTIGVLYENGTGVSKDLYQAVKYYEMSADQGCSRAQYNLGLCYYFGKGVKVNLSVALKLITMSSEQGCDLAKKFLENL